MGSQSSINDRPSNPRTAFLTGASGSIGSAICHALKRSRFTVIGVDKVDTGAPLCDSFIQCDLSALSRLAALVDGVISQYGEQRYLIFAHGTYTRQPLSHYDEHNLLQQLADNTLSTFLLLRSFLPHLVDAQFGRIIIIGSQAGATGGFDPAYAASKAALVGMAKSLAREYAQYGIATNVVSPGPVYSRMTEAMGGLRAAYYHNVIPSKCFSSPADVASAVEWLVGCDISVNGATIDIDGGLVRR